MVLGTATLLDHGEALLRASPRALDVLLRQEQASEVVEGEGHVEVRRSELGPADLEAFERGAAGDYLENSTHDLAFHRRLVALAGNERMTAIYDQMLTQTAHLLRTAAEGNPTLQTTMMPTVHRDILDAVAERDADRAREAIEAHYRYAEERLFPGLG